MALADDKTVRKLNAKHRGSNKPTNVLSYPSDARGFLGDVVLARETVWREARAQGKRPADHVSHLVVHGVLHLLDYDHAEPEETAAMRRREQELLARFREIERESDGV